METSRNERDSLYSRSIRGKEMRQRKLGNNVIRDRMFQVGDVIRWVPNYAEWSEQEDRGLGVIIEADGTKCKAYWTGDKTIRKIDMVLERNTHVLQDYAPIPQVKEAIELALKSGRIVEDFNSVRVV